jgi:penicillin-binding protein 1C
MYAGMVRTLLNYEQFYQKYTGKEYDSPIIELSKVKKTKEPAVKSEVPLHAASVWLTYQALKEVKRPDAETGWEYFNSSLDIAWKTGTSYGFKDAWAIGSTPDFVVGVWVGNADGEGRSGLTGTQVAAPILFEVFNLLPSEKQFYIPYDEMKIFEVCTKTGYRASRYCPEVDSIYAYAKGDYSKQCDYHKLIFTDQKQKYRLSQECASIAEMEAVSWFVLPPVQEWYYRKGHPSYESLPPFAEGCEQAEENFTMEFIYPTERTRVFVPVGIEEQQQEIVFEIGHRFPGQKVYWHLDNAYLGETTSNHQFAIVPEKGWHTLTVVDETGESNSVNFEVVNE